MVFVSASVLSLAALLLPSAMALTLNTPADVDADGTLLASWTPAAGDPTFALLLSGPVSIDIATGVNPTSLNESVVLGDIPAGTYKLQAAVGDDIDKVISTSGSFQIGAIGAALGSGNNAASGGAAGNGKGGNADNTSGGSADDSDCPPPLTVTVTAGSAAATAATGSGAADATTGGSKKGKGAGSKFGGKGKKPRSLSAKFGRRFVVTLRAPLLHRSSLLLTTDPEPAYYHNERDEACSIQGYLYLTCADKETRSPSPCARDAPVTNTDIEGARIRRRSDGKPGSKSTSDVPRN
uniref:Uncharacterized protein n=1 Tax=Mycena chlorophos TaxID=658473 RepID=A0ABQ0LJ58_MYCCL|nr:predicted protein [Mycena chlorophos]